MKYKICIANRYHDDCCDYCKVGYQENNRHVNHQLIILQHPLLEVIHRRGKDIENQIHIVYAFTMDMGCPANGRRLCSVLYQYL